MAEIFQNGDLSQGMTGYTGFLNLVDTWTPADDIYVGKPLSNLRLTAGAAEFIGFYDPSGPGSYAYRLAPPAPHLQKALYLEAGSYTLSFDLSSQSSGMNVLQKFEVRLDGAQISASPVWGESAPGVFGAMPLTQITVTVSVASAGMHSLTFGFDSPGFNLDTSFSYAQWSNHAFADNFSLVTQSQALTGSEIADRIGGTAAGDLIWGLGGNDRIDGQAGADTLLGGAGDDLYQLRDAGDVIIEAAGNGRDRVEAWITCDLAAVGGDAAASQIEVVRMRGAGNLAATGNALDNLIIVNGGQNDVDGAAGRDTVSFATATAGVGVDLSAKDRLGWSVVTGGSGADRLRGIEAVLGSAHDDTLTGDDGANRLEGEQGADLMRGLGGSDTYVVEATGDQVFETAGQGRHDLVQSWLAAYGLGEGVEDGRIMAAGAADLAGNTLDNILTAGAGDNRIIGGAGVDTVSYAHTVPVAGMGVTVDLSAADAAGVSVTSGASGADSLTGIENILGSAGRDALTGNAGANVLEGGGGADTLAGGDGSDTYYIEADFVNGVQDTVLETNADPLTGGVDTVMLRTVSVYGYVLQANFENGALLMAGAGDLRGNTLNNVLYAGAGNNILNGDAGNDTVSYRDARAGVTVALDAAGQQATGGSGADTLWFTENLEGSAFADLLRGDAGANLLAGGAGDDTLTGRAGADTLTGGAGQDSFVFDSPAADGGDRITDFTQGQDRILLDHAAFADLAPGALLAGAFQAGAAAVQAGQRILHDAETGSLWFDADGAGTGAALQIGQIAPGIVLTAADFWVI